MSRELVAYVHVGGRVFAPGEDVPDEYAKRITNPAAWGDDAAKPEDKGAKAPARRRSSPKGE